MNERGLWAVAQTPHPIQPELLDYYNELRERMNALPELMEGDDLRLEVVEPKEDRNNRSHARRVALQALYELDAAPHDLGTVLTVHLANLKEETVPREYANMLIRQVMALRPQLDTIIRQFAPSVPIDQLALIDRNILRLALAELLITPTQPIGAVIDEAVELATHFGSESSASFVNGVLGAVVEDEAQLATLRDSFAAENESEVDASDEDSQ